MVNNWKNDNNTKSTSNKVNMEFEKLVILCDGESPEHQAILVRDPDDGEVWLQTHLVHYDGFFKRLFVGLKYAFGYRSKYGDWDNIVISKASQEKIVSFFKTDLQKD